MYLASRFPALTQTFVAREIQTIAEAGHDVTVCELRVDSLPKADPPGVEIKGIRIVRWNCSIFSLLVANLRLLLCAPDVYWSCLHDLFGCVVATPSRVHHMLYIFVVDAWLAGLLRGYKVDHVRAHFLRTEAVAAMWLSRMLGVPFSVTAHVARLDHSRRLMRRVVQEASFVVADTREVQEFIRSIGKDSRYLAQLVRNGIDITRFHVPDREESMGGSLPRILAVGTLKDQKGFDILLRACGVLKRHGLRFECRIVGDGPCRPELERICRDLGLNQVVFVGNLAFPQLMEEYQKATIFVMSSKRTSVWSDGLPTVLIEALAMGIPTVATRWAGIPDLIIDHQTGLLAEPNDSESLASKIEQMLSDLSLRRYVARNGRAKVEHEFNLHENISLILRLMQQERDNNHASLDSSCRRASAAH